MYKQVIIARKDLDMSPGKLAVQASHASNAFLLRDIKRSINPDSKGYIYTWYSKSKIYTVKQHEFDADIYDNWICGEYTKIVLQANDKNHLLKAKSKAEKLGFIEDYDFFLIYDNCHTELTAEEDGKILTTIGFRPMPSEVIDKITKRYRLYT